MSPVVRLANQFFTLVNDLLANPKSNGVKDSQDLAYTLKKKLEHALVRKLVVQFVSSRGWLIEIDKKQSDVSLFADVVACLENFKPLEAVGNRSGELPEARFVATDLNGDKHTVQVSELSDTVWIMINY